MVFAATQSDEVNVQAVMTSLEEPVVPRDKPSGLEKSAYGVKAQRAAAALAFPEFSYSSSPRRQGVNASQGLAYSANPFAAQRADEQIAALAESMTRPSNAAQTIRSLDDAPAGRTSKQRYVHDSHFYCGGPAAALDFDPQFQIDEEELESMLGTIRGAFQSDGDAPVPDTVPQRHPPLQKSPSSDSTNAIAPDTCQIASSRELPTMSASAELSSDAKRTARLRRNRESAFRARIRQRQWFARAQAELARLRLENERLKQSLQGQNSDNFKLRR